MSAVCADPWGVLDEVRALRAEVNSLPEKWRAELERREQDRILNTTQAAQLFGKNRKSFDMWLRRGGQDVAALAREVGGRKSWLKSDLLAFVAGKVGK